MLKHLVRTPARMILPVALLAAAAPLAAQEPASPQQREHEVRRGDTLWDLARAYLDNPFLWRLIYDANRDVVDNPHWIYPAERLIIPPVLATGATDSPPRRPLGAPLGTPVTVQLNEQPMAPPMVADSPTVVGTVDLRRPVIGMAEYLAAPWLSQTAEREVSGSVLRLADPSAVRDRLASTLHPNDRVHIGDLGANRPQVGDSLLVVRFGRPVANRGVIVEPLAVLLVEAVDASVATGRVVRQFGTARLGDSVLPMSPLPTIGLGQAEPVQNGPEGELLEFLVDEPLYGPTDIAFISVGGASGVGIGDEFGVYAPTRGIRGQAEQLPPEPIGTLRVVKVSDNSATVRVLTVRNAALAGGLPVYMIRRMP